MIVEIDATKITFGDLKAGDSFRYDDAVFIKLNETMVGAYAVNLSTGQLTDFMGSDYVTNRNGYKVVPVGDGS